MKPFHLLVAAALALPACSKPNDVPLVQDDAHAIAAYYQPRVELLTHRLQAIIDAGKTIPSSLPDIADVGKALTEARDKIQAMQQGIETLPKQADTLAKSNRLDELAKLVDDAETQFTEDMRIANDDLSAAEGWIARARLALAAADSAGSAAPAAVPSEPPPAP
ncbi:MAG TPA: hypothetical protein VLX92_32165 [Kofleriaceae bacterium]|nr:hypothetical protein [Kofleriaceae bacterium]